MSDIEDLYPLSPLQQGLLFHGLYEEKRSLYFEQPSCTIEGDINIAAFRAAWQAVVDRHPALRTSFLWEGVDEPLQVVRRQAELPWIQQDWRGLPESEQQARLSEYLAQDRARGFDLGRAPLLRLALLQFGDRRFYLVWSFHHVILDGWSGVLLFKELLALYDAYSAGYAVELPPVRPYRDYIAWLQRQDLGRAEQYWREQLRGLREPTPLGIDHGTVGEHGGKPAQVEARLGTGLSAALDTFARQERLTLNTVVSGVWALLLSRYSGHHDVVYGVTVAGRPSELEGVGQMIGLFINTLPLRVSIEPQASVGEWLRRRQAQQSQVRHYDYTPLIQIQGWSEIARGRSLFESILVFENYPINTWTKQQDRRLALVNFRAEEVTNYPLNLLVAPGSDIALKVSYDSGRFAPAAIGRMIGHIRTLLESIVADPACPISKLSMLTPAERKQFLPPGGSTADRLGEDLAIHGQFERQVVKSPGSLAVICSEEELSYSQLNRKANQLAWYLQTLGVRQGDPVGILLDCASEVLVSVLAVMKTGGAYLPLSPSDSGPWLQAIIEDSRARTIVSQSRHAHLLEHYRGRIVELDRELAAIGRTSSDNPENSVTSSSLSYLCHPSRKGIRIEQSAHRARLKSIQDRVKLSVSDAVLFKTPLSADPSGWEFLCPLLHGARVIVADSPCGSSPECAVSMIADYHVSVARLDRSEWLRLLAWCGDHPDKRPISLRHIFTGCEPLPPAVGGVSVDVCPMYSHEETALDVPLRPAASVPDSNASIFILDHDLQPVPIGIAGEIYLSGDRLPRGHSPGLIENPFFPEAGFPQLFKTGDLARRLEDGTPDLCGAIDGHAWIGGRRIDLREVEAALMKSESVSDCIVRARRAETAAMEMVAYVVPAGGFSAERLASYLRATIPQRMLPSVYVPVAALPLTAGGLVDEERLRELDVIDAEVVAAWEETLRSRPDIKEVAVVVQEQANSPAPLCLVDLLPEDPPLKPRTVVPQRISSEQPAISFGGPLLNELCLRTTLTDILHAAARQSPERGIVYLHPDGSDEFQSYAALLESASTVLAGLRALGLKPQDKVVFQFANNRDFIVAFWGCILGGMVPVPISLPPSYQHASGTASKLRNAWELLNRPIILTDEALAPAVRRLADLLNMNACRVETIESLLDGDPDPNVHASEPDDLALLLFTSGSTGIPKGVRLAHRNILSRSAATAEMNGFSAADVSLNWMPLDHVGGIVMFHVLDVFLGSRQVHARTETVLQDPLKWLDWIERYRVTSTWAPNFAFGLINDRAEEIGRRRWDLSSLRFILNGGEAIVPRTARAFLRLLLPHGLPADAMHPAWGMSETSSGVTFSGEFALETTADDAVCVELGRPIPGTSVRVVDAQNQLIREQTTGRVQVMGPTVTEGYYQNPELDREVFTPDGWFNTGDLGFLRNGRLTITGREKDLIIINGINYHCHEIEAAVEEVPGVTVSFTAACPVQTAGSSSDRLAIFFSPSRSDGCHLPDLLKAIRTKLVTDVGVNPDHILAVAKEEIPKTEIGKIQRAKLKQRFEAGEFDSIVERLEREGSSSRLLPDWFYQKVWRRSGARAFGSRTGAACCLMFVDQSGLGEAICAEMAAAGQHPIRVEAGMSFARLESGRYRIHPGDRDHYAQLFACLARERHQVYEILHLWTSDPFAGETCCDAIDQQQELGLYSVLFLTQALAELHSSKQAVRMLVVGSETQFIRPGDHVAPTKATVLGMLRTIAREMPWLECRHVDLAPGTSKQDAVLVLRELDDIGKEPEVAWRNGERLVPRLQRADLLKIQKESLPFKRNGCYLITGGLGGIGGNVAAYLLTRYSARLLLVGRTALPERSAWPEHLRQGDAIGRRIENYLALERLSSEVIYTSADITDDRRMKQVLLQAKERWGCDLDGVIHLAGVFRAGLAVEETRETVDCVLAPKVRGTWVLHDLVKSTPGAMFITFSSVNGFFGGTMAGAYAAANSFLDCFHHFQKADASVQSYSFSWSMWADMGMSQDYEMKESSRALGFHSIPPDEGVNSLCAALCRNQPQLFIGLDASRQAVRRWIEPADCRVLAVSAYFTTDDGRDANRTFNGLAVKDRYGTRSIAHFTQVAEMPLKTSGEIDIDRLLAKSIAATGSSGMQPPTELEREIATIWQKALALPKVGLHDNFFELGGHSLVAIRIIASLRERFEIDLPLRSIFETPTVAGLAKRIEQMRKVDAVPPGGLLLPQPRDGAMPLSFAQQRLWFLDQLEPGSPFYNIPLALRLRGALDEAALHGALGEVVRRHEVLRTTFRMVDGEPVQIIGAPGDMPLDTTSLEGSNPLEQEDAVRTLLQREMQRPFDLSQGPLWRGRLLRLGEQEHVLALVLHHIIADGWSLGPLLRELAASYQSLRQRQAVCLPQLPLQYADYAVWQRQRLQGPVLEEQLDYWRKQLAGSTGPLELMVDHPRSAIHSVRGAQVRIELGAELSAAVTDLSRKQEMTVFMTLLAGWAALLSRYSGQTDISVGTPIAGRTRVELEGLIGFFVNTLVLRLDLAGDPPFQMLLERTREVALGAYQHQELPFERLVEELRPERRLDHTPLFQVMFALQNAPLPGVESRELQISPVEFETGVTRFDLELHLTEGPRGITGFIVYSEALFEAATIERLVKHYKRLLSEAMRDPDQRLSRLSLLSSSEREQAVGAWNQTSRGYPYEATIGQLFEQQVVERPEAVALVFGSEQVSYGALARRANRLAHHLRGLGVDCETPVGIYLERSPELILALLAVVKAGGAYVPLDRDYPQQRLAFMLEDAGVRMIVTEQRLVPGQTPDWLTVVCLDTIEEQLQQQPAGVPGCGCGPANLAYIIYTSGSTGQPKGVGISHQGVLRLVCNSDYVALWPGTSVAQLSNTSFDALTFELWGALLNGGRLVGLDKAESLMASDLARQLRRQAVEVLFVTTAWFNQLVEEGWSELNGVVSLLFGGEAADVQRVREARLGSGPERLLHVYGPTESTTFTTWEPVAEVESEAQTVPIGRPISNTTVYVVDQSGGPAPVGAVGELYIGGDGLARGYLRRPGLTAAKFLPDPFSARPGARLYRSGDLGRYLPDGRIEFIGRRDQQIKLRGYRIELGEIEAALCGHPGVRQAVASVLEPTRGDKRLVAHFVAAGELVPTSGDFRIFLQQQLPDYMIPTAFVQISELPLTANGKVDRRALPAPDWSSLGEVYVAARTPLEELVCGVWAEVLGRPLVGIHDNFFDLGGHSLLATQVVGRLREILRMEVPLRTLFETPTVAALVERITKTSREQKGLVSPPIVAGRRPAELPLSFAQQRLWFIDQFAPGMPAYNMPFFTRITGKLDVEALRRSFNAIVDRHETLRTTFATVEGNPVQVIAPSLCMDLPLTDLSHLPGDQPKTEATRLAAEEARVPFSLAVGPLVRARLLRLHDDEHVLLLTMHHIISDGWSVSLLLREVAAFYNAFSGGAPAKLPALPLQYADFTLWQREWLTGPVLETQLAYWKRQLAGLPVLQLPTDRPRPPVRTVSGSHKPFTLTKELSEELTIFARKERVTLFMALVGCWMAFLSKYSGQNDISVGTPIAGRTHVELEGLIGFFVNTLVLRLDVTGDPSLRTLLERVREVTLGAYEHQDLPFERLVEELQPERRLDRTPLFQVMFGLQNASPVAQNLEGLTLTPFELEGTSVNFDLVLYMADGEQGLVGSLRYSTDLFDHATIDRLVEHFKMLLECVVADPERRLSAISLLTYPERQRILVEWNATAQDFEPVQRLHCLLESQAESLPDRVAVICESEHLSYAAMNRRANQIAHLLRDRGIGPESLVGVCLERTPDLVIAVVGTLKAGAAYLPLDPSFPQERLTFMLEDGDVQVVLTRKALLASLPEAHRAHAVCLDSQWDVIARRCRENPSAPQDAGKLAYVIYTSGSTGKAKGVLIEQRELANYVYDMLRRLAIAPGSSFAMLQPLTVDSSVTMFYPALISGGCLQLVPRERALDAQSLGDWFLRYAVDYLKIAPSHLAALHAAGQPDLLMPSRYLVIGGEGSHWDFVHTLLDVAPPGCAVMNHYGPTETTVGVLTFPLCCDAAPPGASTVPVGRPISNTQAYLLDQSCHPVPVGVPGELYIGGEAVARGYMKQPRLTAHQFVPDRFGKAPGGRLYRTGDLCRYLPDGNIEFLGRVDDQVKIRGFRIEPREIEAALGHCPAVREAVVLARRDAAGQDRLVAYVVPDEETLTANTLRAFLVQKMPAFMIPSNFVFLNALPRGPHGKVDRSALPDPAPSATEKERTFIAPRDSLEFQVAAIWEELLGVHPISVTDNFFEIGGHSLLAVRLMARIEKLAGRKLLLATLFQSPTVEHLAAILRQQDWTAPLSPLVRIQPNGAKRPLFCIHPNGGNVLCYADLASLLGSDQPVYGLQAQALYEDVQAGAQVAKMAAAYLGAMRTVQAEGPYLLSGWSSGGVLAYEMAQQLHARNEKVGLLALIDSRIPSPDDRMLLQDDRILLANLALNLGLSIDESDAAWSQRTLDEQLERLLSKGKAARVVPEDLDLPHVRVLFQAFKTTAQAIHNYEPTPYAGRILLFRATEQIGPVPDEVTLGWGRLAGQRIEVRHVPGNHFTMMRKQNVGVLADQLTICLEQTLAVSARDNP